MANILDGSRIIPAGSITAHATLPDVYEALVTQEFETVTTETPDESNTFHIAMWADDTLLTAHLDGGTIEDNETAVAADAGSFCANLQGSTESDPRIDAAGTDYRYVFKLPDGGDPRSNGVPIYYAEQAGIVALPYGSTLRDLTIQRTAGKDMSGAAGTANLLTTIEGCIFRDAAIHAWVGGPAQFNDCEAWARGDGRAAALGGGGFHFFRNEANGAGVASGALRCYANGFRHGFYSHGLGTGPEATSVTLTDCEAEECVSAITAGWSEDGWTVEGFTATRCNVLADSNTGGLTIGRSDERRSSYLSALTGDCIGINLNSDVTIEDTDFTFESVGTNRLYRNQLAQSTADDELFYTLTLRRVTSAGGFGPSENSFYAQIDLVLEDCNLGELCTSALGDYPFRSITATGSTFGLGGRSLATIQGDHPGVDGTNTILA